MKLFDRSLVKDVDGDQILMLQVQKGDQKAFEKLYESYKGAVMSFVTHLVPHLAEEMTQEAFLRLYRQKESYVPTASFKTYLFTIARNLCLDHLRSPKSRELPLTENELESLEGESELERDLMENANQEILESCLGLLNSDQKECLLHRTVSELSYQEISAVMGLDLANVKTLLFRAKKSLIECVKRKTK